MALVERDAALSVVQSPLPAALLQRLHDVAAAAGAALPSPDADADAAVAAPAAASPLAAGAAGLPARDLRFHLQVLGAVGEYQELLVPVLHHRILPLLLHLLRHASAHVVHDVASAVGNLLAHRKFAVEFVDAGASLEQLLHCCCAVALLLCCTAAVLL